MATRAELLIQTPDGIKGVELAVDGYPAHVIPILTKHYATYEQAHALLSLGRINHLCVKMAPVERGRLLYHTNKRGKHSLATPQRGVTVAFHRDRGDALEIRTYWLEEPPLPGTMTAYQYWYVNDRWLMRQAGGTDFFECPRC